MPTKSDREYNPDKTPYPYRCSICGFEEDLYYHMDQEKPKKYRCHSCGSRASMHRVFGRSSVHIPLDWGSTENKIRFNKSPSGRKHFW